MRSNQKPKVEFLPPRETCLNLSKREVIERELNTAIRLFFSQGDPVAVHVLVSAAHEILTALGKAKGVRTTDDDFFLVFKDEYVQAVKERVRAPYNFFKHGARDPESSIDFFDPAINEIQLFLAIKDYVLVFGESWFEGLLYTAWMLAERPELLKPEGIPLFSPIIENAFPSSCTTREQRLATVVSHLANYDANPWIKEAAKRVPPVA